MVKKIVIDSGFVLNDEKTRLASANSNRRIVTGIDVKLDHLTIPSQFRKKISQEIYHIEQWGLHSHIARRKIRDPMYLSRLIGKLSYWQQVEPSSKFVAEKLKFLHKLQCSST